MTDEQEAGWFPDPSGAIQERFWDGTSWTKSTRPYAGPGGRPSISNARADIGDGGTGISPTTTSSSAQKGRVALRIGIAASLVVLLAVAGLSFARWQTSQSPDGGTAPMSAAEEGSLSPGPATSGSSDLPTQACVELDAAVNAWVADADVVVSVEDLATAVDAVIKDIKRSEFERALDAYDRQLPRLYGALPEAISVDSTLLSGCKDSEVRTRYAALGGLLEIQDVWSEFLESDDPLLGSYFVRECIPAEPGNSCEIWGRFDVDNYLEALSDASWDYLDALKAEGLVS